MSRHKNIRIFKSATYHSLTSPCQIRYLHLLDKSFHPPVF